MAGRHHWSNGARGVKFFSVNAIAAVPLIALMFHPSMNIVYFEVVLVAFLFVIERVLKMTVRAFLRSISQMVTGRIKAPSNAFKDYLR